MIQLAGRLLGKGLSQQPRVQPGLVPDLNLLPGDLTGRRLTPGERRLILLGIVLSVLAFLQFQVYGDRAVDGLKARLPSWFQAQDPLAAQAAELRKQNTRLAGMVEQGQVTLDEARRSAVPWGDLLEFLHANLPQGVTLESTRETGTYEVTLGGSGGSLDEVFTYQEALKQTDAIQNIELTNLSRSTAGRYAFTIRLAVAPGVPVAPH